MAEPLTDATVLVVGGAGLIGSHIADLLLAEPVREVRVFDSLVRGTRENLEADVVEAVRDAGAGGMLLAWVADPDGLPLARKQRRGEEPNAPNE